jgi:hypothetical protein
LEGKVRKHISLLLCGLALASYSTAQAAPENLLADSAGRDVKTITTLSPKAQLGQDINVIQSERSEFTRNYSWEPADYAATLLAYNQQMDTFNRRELELKQKFFESQNDAINAQRIKTQLHKLDNPQKSQSLSLERKVTDKSSKKVSKMVGDKK